MGAGHLTPLEASLLLLVLKLILVTKVAIHNMCLALAWNTIHATIMSKDTALSFVALFATKAKGVALIILSINDQCHGRVTCGTVNIPIYPNGNTQPLVLFLWNGWVHDVQWAIRKYVVVASSTVSSMAASPGVLCALAVVLMPRTYQ